MPATHRQTVHAILSATGDDWIYNRHGVSTGADANDAPDTIDEADTIARHARANGCDPATVAQWLSAATNAIRSV